MLRFRDLPGIDQFITKGFKSPDQLVAVIKEAGEAILAAMVNRGKPRTIHQRGAIDKNIARFAAQLRNHPGQGLFDKMKRCSDDQEVNPLCLVPFRRVVQPVLVAFLGKFCPDPDLLGQLKDPPTQAGWYVHIFRIAIRSVSKTSGKVTHGSDLRR